ncbi:MAG: hypothetical protein HY892_18075 [Deltaproteobacteria bacterium]|nr:hypothetical protein [Deltaproteobacteria bacterium]
MKKAIWRLLLVIGLVISPAPVTTAAEPEPFRWGLTVEEMNQVWAKTGQTDTILREEPTRLNVILPYNPLKAIKVQRGRLTTVFQVKKTEGSLSIGKMFGYLYNGKLFCRAQLFKDSSVFSTQEVVSRLKKEYPEGKVFRNITGPTPTSHFEYLSNTIYVFSNEEGVYYCDPYVLSKAVREAQSGIEAKDAKDLEELRDALRGP